MAAGEAILSGKETDMAPILFITGGSEAGPT